MFLIGTSVGVRFGVVAQTWLPLFMGIILFTVGGWLFVTSYQQSTEEAGSVSDVIPSWQYTGRHVESGGLSRDEQEQAIQDVQQNAEELERTQPHVQDSRES